MAHDRAVRRLSVEYARAALWAARAVRRARRQLSRGGVDSLDLPPSPAVPPEAVRGVHMVINRLGATCLVDAAVRQRWHADHGQERALIIGVTAPARGFEAHAWLEGDDPQTHQGFSEIHRHRP